MAEGQREQAELEQVILRLLAQRSPGASICPSDAARAAQPGGWRSLMDEVRAAAGRLAARGEVVITQGPRVVDISAARGPVRIRRAPSARGGAQSPRGD